MRTHRRADVPFDNCPETAAMGSSAEEQAPRVATAKQSAGQILSLGSE
jgi:hypothetical protein